MPEYRIWNELRDKMEPERQARIEAEVAEMVRRMRMKAARQSIEVPSKDQSVDSTIPSRYPAIA